MPTMLIPIAGLRDHHHSEMIAAGLLAVPQMP
jgi:hypothetical protein